MKNIKKVILFLYSFYIIYLPDFSFISPIFTPYLVGLMLVLLNSIILNRKLVSFIYKSWVGTYLLLITFFSIYIIIVNYLNNGSYSSFVSNVTYIFNVINFTSLYLYLCNFKYFYNESISSEILNFLLYASLLQAAFIFLTPFVPVLKELAISLYTQEDSLSNFYVSVITNRVNGIGSSYTFMLPLIQALMSIISLYLYRTTNLIKYIFISLLLIISSSMNNRTGIYIYMLIIVLWIIYRLIIKSTAKEKIAIILLILVIPTLIIVVLQSDNSRFNWISEGINDIILWLKTGDAERNVGALTGSFIILPKGYNLIFGTGDRIFGEIGNVRFGVNSDIGYINDIFKGGILYIVLFYYINYKYLISPISDSFLKFSLMTFIIIANYKGEVMTGSPLLMLILMLVLTTVKYRREGNIGEENYNINASL